jgi:redox-sensitive bicupin YhaK (pirin superfamily)
MSPSDFGRILKPFVFLDPIDNQGRPFTGFGLHPHSGIATVTYIAEGSVRYEDTNGATGLLSAGSMEWMRAGGGVWHDGGLGEPGRTRGFQLWIALPPALELGPSESLYLSPEAVPSDGPARVLVNRRIICDSFRVICEYPGAKHSNLNKNGVRAPHSDPLIL